MSTTGFDQFKDNNLKQALIYNCPICPNCNKPLEIIHKYLKNAEINIRYECKYCGFICPIGRDACNLEKEFPLYDSSINSFMEDFSKLFNKHKTKLI